MKGIVFKLALRQLRGSRSRVTLLLVCIALGVAAQVAISSFVSRLNRHLTAEARNLLTADLEILKRTALSVEESRELTEALPKGARRQDMISFVTMAAAVWGNASRLVELRAVGPDYPYYGSAGVQEQGRVVESMRKLSDETPFVYVQPELLAQMNLREGDNLRIGRLDFKIAGVVTQEPGLGAGIFSLGPRIFIGIRHLEKTQLIQTGSRAQYVTQIALENPESAEALSENLKNIWELPARRGRGFTEALGTGPGITVRTPKDRQSQMSRSFERLADFLRLASLVALLLGGIGVGSVMRSFVQDNLESAATLRTLGATEKQILGIFLLQAAGAGAAGSLLGGIIGTAAQNAFSFFFSGLFPVPIRPGLDWSSIAAGIGFGTAASLYFSLLPILRIKGLKPVSIFRNDPPSAPPLAYRAAILLGGAILLALCAMAESRSVPLGLLFSGSILGCCAIMVALARFIVPAIASIRAPRFAIRHALSNLARPQLHFQSVIVTLGVAALLLGFMTIYQHSLTEEIRPRHGTDALPNLFVIDVQDDQMDALKKYFENNHVSGAQFHPMITARYRSSDVRRFAADTLKTRERETSDYMRDREQNLSYRDHLSPDETILQGRWIDIQSPGPEVSLEESFAKRIGAKLGDPVTFDVQGVLIRATVTSLRRVRWTSFKPNFFILMTPSALADAPKTWVGAVSGLSTEQIGSVQRDLVRLFPNFTIFDVAEGGKKLLKILSSIHGAMRSVALFSVLAGLVVLAGLALTTARQRREEATLLKLLGAGPGTIFLSTLTEFFLWGAISVSIGLGLAIGLSWAVLAGYFNMTPAVPWLQLSVVGTVMILLSAGIGVALSRGIFFTKPMEVLRNA